MLRRLLKKKKPIHGMECSFKFKGHSFYAFTDQSDLIKQRQMIWAVKSHDVGQTISYPDLLAIAREGRELLNNGDIARLGALLEMMESNLLMYSSLKNMLSVANALILVDDEPIETLTPEHTQLKQELCEKYPEVRDFFLSVSISSLKTLMPTTKDLKNEDFLNPNLLKIESQLQNLIRKNIYKGWSETSEPILNNPANS